MPNDDTNQAMDAVLMKLGWRGRYQLSQLGQALACILPLAYHILSIVFIGKENEHRCREIDPNATSHVWPPPDAINVTYGRCSVTWLNVTGKTMEAPCPNGLEYAEPVDRTMMSEHQAATPVSSPAPTVPGPANQGSASTATFALMADGKINKEEVIIVYDEQPRKWNLVCENEALTDVSQTLLLGGMMVGAVLFTSLADKFGRKPLHIFCQIGLLFTGAGAALVPSFGYFLPLRFFTGAFQQGTGLCAGILCMEILPARRRFAQAFAGSFLWASSMVIMCFVAFLMRYLPWRYLQLAFAGYSIYGFVLIWTMDESMRWLVANGRFAETEKILRKAAAINKVNVEDVLDVFRTSVLKHVDSEKPLEKKQHHDNDHIQVKTGDEEDGGVAVSNSDTPHGKLMPAQEDKTEDLAQYNILDFFRHKYVFLCVVVNSFAWIVNAMTYYGLSMTSVSLTDNMYLGFFLSAVVEVPCAIVFIMFIERLGRKRCCDIFHVIAGLSLLASVSVSSLAGNTEATRIGIVALALLGKFAISVSFAILFLFTPEQFPTTLRNASLGMVSMAGRVGGMIAPYSRTLSRHVPWGPGVIFGVFCLLVPLSMRVLPETSGRELPQTIEQMVYYIKTPYSISKSRKEKSEKESCMSEVV